MLKNWATSAVSPTTDFSINSLYLSINTFGSGQCRFGMSNHDVEMYNFSKMEEPPGGKHTVIAVLSPPNAKNNLVNTSRQSFGMLTQTTLLLEWDISYGTCKKIVLPLQNDANGKFLCMHQEFDDLQSFFYNGRLWVLYMGQRLNEKIIHIQQKIVLLKIFKHRILQHVTHFYDRCLQFKWETSTFGITWAEIKHPQNIQLRVSFTIHWRLLGIAHFHWLEHCQLSNYACHGHHYTHAIFAIIREEATTPEDSAENRGNVHTRPFRLKRLSNEFVFWSLSLKSGEDVKIIQFASGLDVVGSEMNGNLIVSFMA